MYLELWKICGRAYVLENEVNTFSNVLRSVFSQRLLNRLGATIYSPVQTNPQRRSYCDKMTSILTIESWWLLFTRPWHDWKLRWYKPTGKYCSYNLIWTVSETDKVYFATKRKDSATLEKVFLKIDFSRLQAGLVLVLVNLRNI